MARGGLAELAAFLPNPADLPGTAPNDAAHTRTPQRIKATGAARRTRFRDRGRSAGRRLKQISRTLRRRTGQALAEIDRLTGEVAAIATATLRDVATVEHNA
ncbi:hypothetical protein GCM10011579_006230 [Streptomyces albiflavescens]|uniref:Uncharacterized protein n=1 Tax=Streptomyces albiflavescens TaxID=1623582 RepID=A0A917XRR0_9ACTN|nr:hypothetical protein GCM10011579_006230 [Streptomyces albiflavescens]